MWEQIRANKRRSIVLVFVMAVLLMALGFAIGQAVYVEYVMPNPLAYVAEYPHATDLPRPDFLGGLVGMAIAFGIWGIMTLAAYSQGSNILMALNGARPIEKQDAPQLFNVVEEMTIAAGLGKMPKVYVIDDPALNAFATGRSPQNAAVAVTRGLLGRLNRDQLQGVVGHEMSHIVNRDVLFMTLLGIMAGAIVLIADVFLRGLYYSGGSRSRRSRYSGGDGKGQALFIILAVVLAILSPIVAQLIYLAASRRREYLADAGAAVLTRYPPGLASALEVLRGDPGVPARANRATAPMYIHNPLGGTRAFGLTSTHPPIDDRIRILLSMGGSASYLQYQAAWEKTEGKRAGHLPASALAAREPVPFRAPSSVGAPSSADTQPPAVGVPLAVARHPEAVAAQRQQLRDAGDLVRKVNQFLFLSCTCGLRLKLPPGFNKPQVECPRCHRELAVPGASQPEASVGIPVATPKLK